MRSSNLRRVVITDQPAGVLVGRSATVVAGPMPLTPGRMMGR